MGGGEWEVVGGNLRWAHNSAFLKGQQTKGVEGRALVLAGLTLVLAGLTLVLAGLT